MLNPIVVKEPRVNVSGDTDLNHIVYTGGKRTSTQVYVSESYQLNSAPVNASWSITPPSNKVIVDRFFKVRYYFECTATGGDFSLYLHDAPRQFPGASITDVVSLSINGETVSENVQRKLHAMLCYGNTKEDRNKSWSLAPSKPDAFQQYSDFTAVNGGSNRNPLGGYGEDSSEQNRSVSYEVLSSTKVRFIVTEPLFISPLYQGIGHQQEGMVNVNELMLNLRFSSDNSRVWSHSTGGNAITAVSSVFYRAPELLINYITPLDDMKLPEIQLLPYQKCHEYVKTLDDIAVGGSLEAYSDTIRLASIPKYIYLFARRRDDQNSFLTSDSFPSIEKINVQWDNQNGLLSSATPQDLFEISRRNGYNQSWLAFKKYRGSVLCLEMGKDIGLEPNQSIGLRGSFNIQIDITFKNQSSSIFKGEMMMVVCNTGVFQLGNNSASVSIGNLDESTIVQARKNAPEVHHSNIDLEGGSFWSGLKNIVNKVAHFASPIVSAVAPEFSPLVEGVKSLTGSGLSGGRMSGGRMSGGMVRRIK